MSLLLKMVSWRLMKRSLLILILMMTVLFLIQNKPLCRSLMMIVSGMTHAEREYQYSITYTLFLSIKTAIEVGLEETEYTTPEGDVVVEVCAVVISGSLQRDAVVTLQTQDISATGW